MKCQRLIKRLIVLAIFILPFCAAGAISENYKWTDSNGRVHYGSSVPPEYVDSAEKLEIAPLNTVAPEPEVKRRNERAVRKLKQQDAMRRQQPLKEDNSSRRRGSLVTKPSLEEARKRCRDNYVTVKKRTECFNQAANN